jgi:hypothetical protein
MSVLKFNSGTGTAPFNGGNQHYQVYTLEFPPPFRDQKDLVGPQVIPQGYSSAPSMMGGAAGSSYNTAAAHLGNAAGSSYNTAGGAAYNTGSAALQPYRSSYTPGNIDPGIFYNSVQAVGYPQAGMPNNSEMAFVNPQAAYLKVNGVTTGLQTAGSRYQNQVMPKRAAGRRGSNPPGGLVHNDAPPAYDAPPPAYDPPPAAPIGRPPPAYEAPQYKESPQPKPFIPGPVIAEQYIRPAEPAAPKPRMWGLLHKGARLFGFNNLSDRLKNAGWGHNPPKRGRGRPRKYGVYDEF